MGRLEELKEEDAEVPGEESKFFKRNIKKIEKLSRKSDKKTETILVQYLTAKNQVIWKVCKIVAGNLVVIDNKVHVLNPKKVWRYKKSLWYIIREIDRKPVSNMDYDKVVARGDDTDSDVPLIKAVLGAIEKKKDEKKNQMMVWIIIGIIILAAVAFFTFYKSKGG